MWVGALFSWWILASGASEPAVPADAPAPGVVESGADGDPATGKTPDQPSTRLSTTALGTFRARVRGGRMASTVGWGMVGAGALLVTVGAPLGVYDPPKDWTKVGIYQRRYLDRSSASGPLLFTGLALTLTGVPVHTAGVMVEARALARITGRPPTVGWVGTGLMIGGFALAFTPVTGVSQGGLGLVAAGWGCVIGQWVINTRTAHGLDASTREALYGRPRRVEAVVLPQLGTSPGVMIGGRF